MDAPALNGIPVLEWFRRKVYIETSKIITCCYLCSQGRALFGRHLCLVLHREQRPLPKGRHSSYAGDRTPSGPEPLEPQRRPCDSFHRSMIVLHNIIEILRLAKDQRRLLQAVERLLYNGCFF